MFTVAVRAADPGEAGARIAAVEIALDDILDDRPEMAVLLLKTAFVDRLEPVEVMEQHPIEDRPLWMLRAIDSRHIGKADSRGVPKLPEGGIGDQARNRSTAGYVQSIIKADLDQILTKPKEKPRRLGTDRDDSVSGFSLEKGLIWDFQGGLLNGWVS